MAKLSKDYAQYGEAKSGGDRCDECKWFRAGSCEVVKGKIGPDMWCRFWHGSGGKTRLVRKQDADRDYVRRMRSG